MGRIVRLTVFVVLIGLLALPAFSAPQQPTRPGNLLNGPSALVGFRYYVAHPNQAPGYEAASRLPTPLRSAPGLPRAHGGNPRAPFGDLFNRDSVGLPQNETSISDCTSNPKVLLGGTNDYRALIDPEGNFTGWHLSVDGGRTVANEGLLPPVQAAGQPLPSGGDPVFATGKGCSLYGASLNYGSGPLGETPSAVGVYRSDVQTATSCPQGESAGGLTHPLHGVGTAPSATSGSMPKENTLLHAKRALNFDPYGRVRPATMASSTAVLRILLTRKRSQVQTLSRPPSFLQVNAAIGPAQLRR
jgi:hypothetical protein